MLNFLFTDDVSKKQKLTQALFSEIAEGEYEGYISELVLVEINKTEDKKKRDELLKIVQRYKPKELPRSEEVYSLAAKYIETGIIPKRFEADALHIAYGVVNNLDAVISWNMRHIVNLKTRWRVNSINKIEGYKEIELVTPEEVIGYED